MELLEEFESAFKNLSLEHGYKIIQSDLESPLNQNQVCYSNGSSVIKLFQLGWDNYWSFRLELDGKIIRTIDLGQYVDISAAVRDLLDSLQSKLKAKDETK